jgi:hypothetical protein
LWILAGLVLCSVAILLVPLRATLQVGWDEGIPLFEIRVWGLTLRRRKLPSWVRRWANKAMDRILRALPSPMAGVPKPTPAASSGRKDPMRLVWWGLAVVGRFLSQFTRRLEFRLGGVDPALLGLLTGILGGIAAAAGLRLRWIPQFQPGPFRFRLRWTISISLFGIFLWLGRSASLFPRKTGRPGLLPSAP